MQDNMISSHASYLYENQIGRKITVRSMDVFKVYSDAGFT